MRGGVVFIARKRVAEKAPPLIRPSATFPLWGKALQRFVFLKQFYRTLHGFRQRAVIFQHGGRGGAVQRGALGFQLL